MSIIRKITDDHLAKVATTKLVTVGSTEYLYTIESGNRAFEVTNHGDSNVYYGASSVLASTGSFVAPDGSKYFDHITSDFILYFATTDSDNKVTFIEFTA